jgi:hypothetical protein
MRFKDFLLQESNASIAEIQTALKHLFGGAPFLRNLANSQPFWDEMTVKFDEAAEEIQEKSFGGPDSDTITHFLSPSFEAGKWLIEPSHFTITDGVVYVSLSGYSYYSIKDMNTDEITRADSTHHMKFGLKFPAEATVDTQAAVDYIESQYDLVGNMLPVLEEAFLPNTLKYWIDYEA